MRTTNAQVRKLMEEMSRHGQVGRAALRSGMDRKTARKYVGSGKLPSDQSPPRSWRTRPDPFEEDWPALAERLEAAPTLEGRALFEDLLKRQPGRYDAGQLRTFQRRVKEWRAAKGPEKEVFFPQSHRPGEAGQTDFTTLVGWASRSPASLSLTCCATSCCRTRTGSGPRCAIRSRCWRCGAAFSRPCFDWGGFLSTTRRTTPRRRRTICERASVASTRSTSR